MRLLALETSGTATGAAVMQDGIILSEHISKNAREAEETLLPLCDLALKEAGFSAKDMDAFAVSIGPGSFTGVRIGVCAANALSQAAGTAVIEVCSLCALAMNSQGNVIAAVDARRERVYAAGFGAWPFETQVMELEALVQRLGACRDVTLVGDAAQVYGAALKARTPHVLLGDAAQSLIYARSVARVAYEKYCRGETVSQAAPAYMGKPQAERKLDEPR